MTFQAYRASPFSHAHENHVFNQLYDLLQHNWVEQDQPLHLLGNFYVEGAEIDAMIVKRNAVIVIDFKDYGGNLRFSENGRWSADDKEVRGGNKTNPYRQIRDNKFQLLNYFKNQIDFQSSPNLGHIAGLCLFHQAIDFDASTLPHNINRWFHICDMKSVIRSTDAIVSSAISFSNADIEAIISKLDVPVYHPDGRPIEEPLSPFEDTDNPSISTLNREQDKALVEIENWLHSTNSNVFSLSGAFYTGKYKVLEKTIQLLLKIGKIPLYLAPNARIANYYKTNGINDVNSIYSWLYAGRPDEIKNGKAIYPISHDPVDSAKEVIVILASHLLGDEIFETETTVYGSGYILRDLLKALKESKVEQSSLEFAALPKILLIGDPYQLTRGGRDKSLLSCQIFQQHKIGCVEAELNSQDRDDHAPNERLDFQKILIGQIKSHKFVQLPVCQQGAIKTITKGEQTDNIAKALLQWPRRTAYLCAKNETAQSVNSGIRKKYLNATSIRALTEGDIVDIHNRTLNLQINEFGQTEIDWVSSGEFARVVSSDTAIESRSIKLKGRESPVTVDFARATIEYSGGIAEIIYLPDFLAAPKPELTQHQVIALQIFAKEEADLALVDQKVKLDSMSKEEKGYKQVHQQYRDSHNMMVMDSKYTNAARLRYAYALTVHRAQAYDPMPRVILDGRTAHDTENPATDSYFRWLYTATTCTSDALQILDYPELTPLSKAQWSFASARFVPITFKSTLYYQKDRTPTDAELATPLPTGFNNPESRLLAILLTIYELIGESEWRVECITQLNYKERYLFSSDSCQVLLDLNYNGNYDFSIGTAKVINGSKALAVELKQLLGNAPVFIDENIATAVDIFKDHIARKNWSVVNVDEKNYKVFLIAKHELGKIKLELNVPSDASVSKKGVISSVKVQQADSEQVARQFEEDFVHG